MPRLLAVSLALSGASALIDEVLWVRLLGDLFGHTAYAIQAVLAVFFGGMAAGSLFSDRLRTSGRRLLAVYAGLEAGVGICGLLVPDAVRLLAPVYDRLAPLGVEDAGALPSRLLLTAILVLPPTAAMGASFPLAVRWLAATGGGSALGSLYAANTLGGALGAWAAAFVLIPVLGVRDTLAVAAAGNMMAAALALCLWARSGAADPEHPSAPALPAEAPVSGPALGFLLLVTGAVAIGLEVLWTRALDQVLSGTVYSFATVLSVYLAGIALGGWAYRRRLARFPPLALLAAMELLLAVLVIASLFLLRGIPALSERLSSRLGPGFLQRGVVLESLLSGALLLLPASCMGVLFPLLLGLALRHRPARGPGVFVAANTAGAVAAPLVCSLVLLPSLGLRSSLLLVSAVCFSLAASILFIAGPPRRIPLAVAAALTLLILAGAPRDVRLWDRAEESLIDYREDPAATVSVVADRARPWERRLKVNNTYFLGGGLGVGNERRQAHLAMLLHPSPARVLVLGVGTADTLGAVSLYHPQRLLAVELLPGVVEMARRHFAETNERVLDDPAVRVLAADAVRVARAGGEPYDVVIGDLFHPWQRGVGALYSREHFQAVRRRLAPGGLFCQWLPIYQLSTDDLRTVLRTFLDVYPETTAWLGNFGIEMPMLGLVGADRPVAVHWSRWEAARADARIRASLASGGLEWPWDLAGSYLAGRPEVQRFAGPGRLNTLDEPIIEFDAPRALFADRFRASLAATLRGLLQPESPPEAPLSLDGADTPDRAAIAANTRAAQWMLEARLSMEEGDAHGGLEAALRSARAARGYERPLSLLANVAWWTRRQEPALALEAFEEVLGSRPDEPGALLGLGEACLLLHRPQRAAEAFRRALALQPGWPEAAQDLRRAEAMRAAAP
jgi:spermidine synthase